MNHYEIINEYNGEVKYDFLPKIIDKCLEMEHVENAIFSIIFIDDEKMHELNKTYRGIDRTTDVLSFAYEDNETIECDYRMLGEIFVSIPKMKGQAIEYGHSETRELSFLVVHGILHLLGYDHTLGEKEEKEGRGSPRPAAEGHGGGRPGSGRLQPGDRGPGVHRSRGSLRLRQVHHPADDRGTGGDQRRRADHRR